jgi:hypothetical protein
MHASAPTANPRRRGRRALGIVAIGGALVLSGCGSAPQPGAVTFVRERQVSAIRAQQAVREAQSRLQQLGSRPTTAALVALRRSARIARERVNEARFGLPTSQVAEEELAIAESEAGVGANELNYAMGELVRYARRPTALTLARYHAYLQRGRSQWNEAVTELWRLARANHPPTL